MYYKNFRACLPLVSLLIISQMVLANPALVPQAKKGAKPAAKPTKPVARPQSPPAKQTTAPKSAGTSPKSASNAAKTTGNATKSESGSSGKAPGETVDVTAPDALERIRGLASQTDRINMLEKFIVTQRGAEVLQAKEQ